VRQPGQLVEMVFRYPGDPRLNLYPWKHYERFRDENHVFSDVIAMVPGRVQVTGATPAPEVVDGIFVSDNFFEGLGLRPAIGRLIGPQDRQIGSAGAAVISWSYWQSRFNLDPGVVGRTLVVNDVPTPIVGVTPRRFFGLQLGMNPPLWLPVAIEPVIQKPSRLADTSSSTAVVARLKPGVTIEQAQAEMRVLDRPRLAELEARMQDVRWRRVALEVPEEPQSGVPGEGAEADHYARPEQLELAGGVGETGVALGRRGFVPGRGAADGGGDPEPREPQPVVLTLRDGSAREARPVEPGEEEVAGAVAGEEAARAVRPVGGGGEAEDEDSRSRVAEAGDGAAPVRLSRVGGPLLARHPLPPLDEPRAQPAGDDLALQLVELQHATPGFARVRFQPASRRGLVSISARRLRRLSARDATHMVRLARVSGVPPTSCHERDREARPGRNRTAES
jgi:hypothetical protein